MTAVSGPEFVDLCPILVKKAGVEPLPGYRLLSPLGQGGFGEVWKCEAPGGLHKAIKFVAGGMSLDDEVVPADHELRAIQKVKAIRHPFLLSMERIELVGDELLIVQELADCNLDDVVVEQQRTGKPGIERTLLLRYLGEAAEALDLMNTVYNLQHLDIKPQNLFLVGDHVKVGDFGLVRSRLSSAQLSAFTPLYSAPELFHNQVSQHSDQYSLAIVYQELLTGVFPFQGETTVELFQQHCREEPNLTPLPASDRPVVARALAKNPGDRFSSMSDFVEALKGQRRSSPALSVYSPEESLRIDFPTVLELPSIHSRLQSLQEQWHAQILCEEEEKICFAMRPSVSLREPGADVSLGIDICVSLVPIRDQSLANTDVSVRITPSQADHPGQRDLFAFLAPLLGQSIRSCLEVQSKGRQEKRLPWRYPLLVRAIRHDGTLSEAIECRGKDLSLRGIGFYLPGELPGSRLHLELLRPQQASRKINVRVVRLQNCGSGWYEVGAVLLPST